MKQYNAPFLKDSTSLYQLSHTDPEKIGQQLANFLPFLRLPCLRNSCRIESLLFRNFSLPKLCNAHGKLEWMSFFMRAAY